MRLVKKILIPLVTLILIAVLALILVFQIPIQDPPFQASEFAPRKPVKSLPQVTMQVFETGYSKAPEAYVRCGGSLFRLQRLSHSVVLIRHPQANMVLDSGLGEKFLAQVKNATWDHRLMDPLTFIPTQPLAGQKDFPVLDPKRDFFLISHSHFDHLSGAVDFPDIPLKMLGAERDFSENREASLRHGVFPEQIEALRRRIIPFQLEPKPYENFKESLDLFGDGSIVLVSLAGHTPGSLGVFVNLPSGDRFLFVGDALWTVDGEGRPEARSRVAEWTSDLDKIQARRMRQKLAELVSHSNEVTLVPIHDSRALQKLPRTTKENL